MIIGIDASRACRARRTGTERYSLEIIRHLLALPEATAHGWRLYTDVTPAAHFFAPPQLDAQNVEIRVLPQRRLWTHRSLAREVMHDRPDVLFVPAHVLPFVLPADRLPASVVVVHDLGYHALPETHTRAQRLYIEASTRWSVLVARRVIAVSQATAADLQQYYRTPAARIRVVYEAAAAPTPVDCAQIDAVRTRYGLARPYALFVGTIQPRKNIERLLRAYAWLSRNTALAWDLVFAGAPGWLSEKLYAEAASLGLAEKVHFLGFVADEALPALIKGALFFSFPSLFEGFGLPVLEAQSYGVPVLTSNNSSLPEVAGDAALLVDPTDVDAIANAMLRLSRDEALRQQLIEAGYANVRRFSWEKAAQETLAVLREAAES
ncbi:MAG: glycosyltransferase family 4 protein [Caldilineaceae bacterium]|jgi:glycosyltransferase involved in cell wall biosynthesis|nr:glycosyltransferase family 4 protein [Caldilineaceae bacterium]